MADPKWKVQAPDGKVIQFPDNFTDADVNREMGKMYPAGASASPSAEPAKTGWLHQESPYSNQFASEHPVLTNVAKSFDIKNILSNLYGGAKGAVEGAGAIGKDLVNNPNWVSGPDSTYEKFVGAPAQKEAETATQRFKEGRYSEAAGHELAGAIPVVGPWAASLGEQAGKGDVGGAVSQGIGAYGGGKAMQGAAELPKHMSDFIRRANSLNEVTKAAAGVYQGQVQPAFTKLQESIKNEGAQTIQQAIEADKAATQALPVKGTISTATATAEAAKALDQTGHIPTKQTSSILARLTNDPLISLEDAKNLRSDFGNAASSAKRAGNMKLNKILTAAYEELGNGMKDRISELSGSEKPFEHYNNEFRAYYEMRDGIAGQMQDSLADRHEAIPKLKQFGDADLTELKDQAKKYGLNPDEFDQAQSAAKSVVGAHDSLTGKYNKSLYRMVMSGGGGAAVALPLSVYAVAHGAGMYGLAPLLLASYIGAKVKGLEPQIETGRILQKLRVNPESFQVRTPVEGPMKFDYPDQDDVYSGGVGTGNPPGPSRPFRYNAPPSAQDAPQSPSTQPREPDTAGGKAQAIQRIQQNSPEVSPIDMDVRNVSRSSDTLHVNFDSKDLKSLGESSEQIAAKLFPELADSISRASVGRREIFGKEAGKYHLQVSFKSPADLKAAADSIKGIRGQQP